MAPAPVEIVSLAERPSGLAFEILIKRPAGASTMTPGRARLEGYTIGGAAALPRLLRSKVEQQRRGDHGAAAAPPAEAIKHGAMPPVAPEKQPPTQSLRRTGMQQKQSPPEEKPRTTGRAKELLWRRLVCLVRARARSQRLLASAQPRLSEYSAAARKEKARAHNEEVARKAAECKRSSLAHAERLLEKATKVPRPSAPKSVENAARHNREVLEKMVKTKQAMQDRAQQLLRKASRESMATLNSTRLILDKRCEKARAHNERVWRAMVEVAALREKNVREAKNAANLKEKGAKKDEEATKKVEKVKLPQKVVYTSMPLRQTKARRHNEAVAKAMQKHREAASDKAEAMRQKACEGTSGVQSRTAATLSKRTEVCRKHNAAIEENLAKVRMALGCRTQKIAEKLERKSRAAAPINDRRAASARSSAQAAAAADAEEPMGPTSRIPAGDGVQHRRRSRLPTWLVMVLPCVGRL